MSLFFNTLKDYATEITLPQIYTILIFFVSGHSANCQIHEFHDQLALPFSLMFDLVEICT